MNHEKLNQVKIYQKARELFDMIQAFDATIPEENDYLKTISKLMMENTMIILAKIAGAEGVKFYDIRMQNAAIIRQAGMDLYVQIGSLRFEEEFSQNEYIEMIRTEIDAFRELFKDWIHRFDTKSYIQDEWGLFNPPISPFGNENTNLDDIDWDDEEDDDWMDDEENDD